MPSPGNFVLIESTYICPDLSTNMQSIFKLYEQNYTDIDKIIQVG